MSENYEMKPGLTYIDERNKQFRYSDDNGKLQWVQPLSRYKAFNKIKRGEAVSIVTKDELLNRAKSINSISTITNTYGVSKVEDKTVIQEETLGNNVKATTYVKNVYTIDSNSEGYNYSLVEEIYYSNKIVDDELVQTITKSSKTVYTTSELKVKADFPVTKTETVGYSNQSIATGKDWSDDDVTITRVLTWDSENNALNEQIDAYNKTKVDEIMADPDPYVIQTDTTVHERTVGLALEYAAQYGDEIHIQPYGRFTFDPSYEGKNTDFYGENNTNHDVFDHTGKEYNPGFTYEDVGKKVYIAYPTSTTGKGLLTVDSEQVSKYYHNIICIGYLTDAPQVAGEGKTEIEISISGDQRGLLEATQFEARLGEDVYMSSEDPIRVFAYGKESDTKFKARLCLTPQGGSFKNTDFIAFQRMDGTTSIIYFTEGDFNVDGVTDEDDNAFLHMAKCYANISNESIGTYCIPDFSDTQTVDSVSNNLDRLNSVLNTAFTYIAEGNKLNISTRFDETNAFGYIDMEAENAGGYYAMYVSSGLKSKFDGSITECNGSFENHGLAVLADIRIPERRDILGIYYGTEWNKKLEKGYTTVFMRLGEFDIPETCKQFDGNFTAGQEYYLGMNGRICKYPYNQFDFVNKIGTVKYSNTNDLRFVVDIGESTRHYNGDLPVGYMKPSIYTGTNNVYKAEYGFVIMDGTTAYSKAAPYDALYDRLLGWFDPDDVNITGTDTFHVPAVSRMVPQEVIEEDENGNKTTVYKQVQVPMQIKYLATGVYEEMPRIPFKRFFGTFEADTAKVDDDWTPVKCQITDCDITDIVDYGISEDGYTKPGLDSLDIHLFIDPNENYKSGAHDWHEVREGFFNWNNSTTFGYTWKIIEEDASTEHPYGCFKLSMDVGNSEGVAYVTSDNQAPKKLNGCYYKLYVARREVFSRQFDIEKIYKDYLTNSVYTDDAKSEVVLTKAVTGKAVIDAIENHSNFKSLVANEGATVAIGELGKPVGSLVIDTTSKLPIISSTGIYIQNEYDTDSTNASKVTFIDGILAKGGDYDNTSILSVDNAGTDKASFVVDGNVIPTVKQVRDHAISTIDNKDYLKNYSGATNSTGAIHGMVFGRDGNIDASSIWGIEPKISSYRQLDDYSKYAVYMPIVYKSNASTTTYERDVEGQVNYVSSTNKKTILTEEVLSTQINSNYTISNGSFTADELKDSVVKNVNTKGNTLLATKYNDGTGLKAMTVIDLDNQSISLLKMNGSSLAGGMNLNAGIVSSTSRAEFKRIYGELIRDTSLVDNTTDAIKNAIKYDDDTNKFKTALGSALQAAYELPLAYWQYKTEKEWYKDHLGIIIQRVEDVADNISTTKERKIFDNITSQGSTATTTPSVYASTTIGNLKITAKEIGSDGNSISVKVTLNPDGETYSVVVAKGDDEHKYSGSSISKLHTNESTEDNIIFANDDTNGIVTFEQLNENDELMESDDVVYLEGGSDGEAVSKKLVNTDYKENEYNYTDTEVNSIKEYLTAIVDNSSNGQDIISTVGLLLAAAKETQERLLRVEASTFGRDYETIPGGHSTYQINGMPGVVPDPTNYGLNRLIRAICQEIYYDSNPFDEALSNENSSKDKTTSFSRIDRLDREVHGELNTEDGTQTSTNSLSSIDSTTYPYEDMIRAKDDTEVRNAEYSTDETTEIAKARGTGVQTRVDMNQYANNSDGDYDTELEGNISTDADHFNGLVDAIYRITTKLNALTESINNSDNIADSPVRLNTIRQNIEHIIREAYFDNEYNVTVGNTTTVKNGDGREDTETLENFNTVNANAYHDTEGSSNAPYKGDVSRFDKITDNLYNYTISLTGGNADSNFGSFNDFGDEKIKKAEHTVNENGEVTVEYTEKPVQYTGRLFNGKHLLTDNKPEGANGTETTFTLQPHVPQNLNDYNYATLLDIVVDAIGSEFFRKQNPKNSLLDESYNNIEVKRHNETISTRLDNIEECLDKVVRKLSRAHSFEEEKDITENNTNSSNVERTNGGKSSSSNVFSIDRYIQFLNDYLGYSQTTNDDVTIKDVNDSKHNSSEYIETWANGIDSGISYYDENGKEQTHNLNLDGSANTEYSAEWAFTKKKNIHAGLINTLARLQNEEKRSSNLDAILGDDFKSTASSIKTEFIVNDNNESVQTLTSTANYTLTDDIKDLLLTIYGKDAHNENAYSSDTTNGAYTTYEHRTTVDGGSNTGFASDNIIDNIINEMYYLPQPIRAYDASLDGSTINGYISQYGTTDLKYNSGNVYLPVDNETTTADFINKKSKIKDSRLASYYDFDSGKNVYDIPDNEKALSWDHRDEFFNSIGAKKDSDLNNLGKEYHARLSRFDVIENEIRSLRKLIGLNFDSWEGNEYLIKLKFEGALKFVGTALDGNFVGEPYSSEKGVYDQYNTSTETGSDTNILKFLLNADKSERLLRAELGFSDNSWAKIKPKDSTSGYDYWYDYTYSTSGKKEKETLLSSNIKDGDTSYSIYGLFGQQTDETYANRHSVYDRLVALEQNAVRVDAWLDSVKNIYRSDVGNDKGTGSGNIFDLVNYLGNYTWNAGTDTEKYYGSFGSLHSKALKINDTGTDKFTTVTDELEGHNNAIINIYDVIGTDTNTASDYNVTESSKSSRTGSKVTRANTIWGRLNAVESLNQNDLDITDVVHTCLIKKTTTENNDTITTYENDVIECAKNNNSIASTETYTGLLNTSKKLDATSKDADYTSITSKGYVDNAINTAINTYHSSLGDRVSGTITVNSTNVNNAQLSDETSSSNNGITLTSSSTTENNFYNTFTINDLVIAINKVNGQTQTDVNKLYNNLSGLMTALNYSYNSSTTLTGSTTGSLLKWTHGSTTTPTDDSSSTDNSGETSSTASSSNS